MEFQCRVPLLGMPPEILTIISEHLDWRDIKACRAAGNASLASVLLYCQPYETASVMLSYADSMRVCLEMLQHASIAKKVKTLYINVEEFSDKAKVKRPAAVLRFGPETAKQHDRAYNELRLKQEELRKSQLDVRTLARIL